MPSERYFMLLGARITKTIVAGKGIEEPGACRECSSDKSTERLKQSAPSARGTMPHSVGAFQKVNGLAHIVLFIGYNYELVF